MEVLSYKKSINDEELEFIKEQVLNGSTNLRISRDFQERFDIKITSPTIKKLF